MNSMITKTALLAMVALLIGACANTSPRYDRGYGGDPRYQDNRQVNDSRYDPRYDNRSTRCDTCGIVDRIETGWEPDRASGGGAVLGAIIGGVIGSNIGGGSGRDAATVGGAIAGGIAGHQIERQRQTDRPIYIFQIRLDDGRWAQVTQRDNPGLREGDRVIIRNEEVYLLR